MSFLNQWFGGDANKNPQGQQSSGQGQQNNQPQNQNNQQPNNQGQQGASNNPAGPQQKDGSNGVADPAALYAKMWDNATNKPDAPPSLKMDDKILGEVAGGLSFTKDIPPELMQKATSGDMQSLVQLMEHVGRSSYQASMRHNAAVTDAFVGQRDAYSGKQLSGHIQRELTMGGLFSGAQGKIPDFAKKQFTDIADRYRNANPDASPEEVQTAVKDYITQLSQFANPQSAQQSQNSQPQAVDWDKWASQ